MRDMQAHLEKLRADASECQIISELAASSMKRELFAKLAEHHCTLANELSAPSRSSARPQLGVRNRKNGHGQR